MKVAILGGGIAGLATAWYLRDHADVRVFECSPDFGGKIRTRVLADCTLEEGPDSLLTEKPWGLALCRELGLGDALLPSNDAQRSFSILHQGRLHPFPAGCKLFIPQKILPVLTTRLLSLRAKLRMAREPFLAYAPPADDESLADFVKRHFGDEVLQRLAGPLLGGIYGGDPEDMSMDATFPRLRAMERSYGSLVKGMREVMRKAAANPRPAALFTSLRGGMQQLTDTLATQLGPDRLLANLKVEELRKDGPLWRVNGRLYDNVVMALPASAAAPLLRPLDGTLADLLETQGASSSATLSLVFDRQDLAEVPHGFGFMASHPLPGLLVGCTWTGNKFAHRVPENRFACRLFLGGPASTDLLLNAGDEALRDRALRELRAICPFLPETPIAWNLRRWPHGNPQYPVGHLNWLQQVRTRGRSLGRFRFCGSSYDGVSVSDCARQAQELATDLIEGRTPPPG